MSTNTNEPQASGEHWVEIDGKRHYLTDQQVAELRAKWDTSAQQVAVSSDTPDWRAIHKAYAEGYFSHNAEGGGSGTSTPAAVKAPAALDDDPKFQSAVVALGKATRAASAAQHAPQIEYRYNGGTHWCDLGPAEQMRADFNGVYRLKAGLFPAWQGDSASAAQPVAEPGRIAITQDELLRHRNRAFEQGVAEGREQVAAPVVEPLDFVLKAGAHVLGPQTEEDRVRFARHVQSETLYWGARFFIKYGGTPEEARERVERGIAVATSAAPASGAA